MCTIGAENIEGGHMQFFPHFFPLVETERICADHAKIAWHNIIVI